MSNGTNAAQEVDKEKFKIAVAMFHALLGDDTDPRADISGRTSKFAYQLSYSKQLNAMGKAVSAAGEFRWVTVATDDIGKCKLAGNIITLCYRNLVRVADIPDAEHEFVIASFERIFTLGEVES